jgi:hypothetical protein
MLKVIYQRASVYWIPFYTFLRFSLPTGYSIRLMKYPKMSTYKEKILIYIYYDFRESSSRNGLKDTLT